MFVNHCLLESQHSNFCTINNFKRRIFLSHRFPGHGTPNIVINFFAHLRSTFVSSSFLNDPLLVLQLNAPLIFQNNSFCHQVEKPPNLWYQLFQNFIKTLLTELSIKKVLWNVINNKQYRTPKKYINLYRERQNN